MWESHMTLMGFPLVCYVWECHEVCGTPMAHLGVRPGVPLVSWESHRVCGTPT